MSFKLKNCIVSTITYIVFDRDEAYKVLTTIIHKRLREIMGSIVGGYQYGFVKGKSTIDTIYILKQISENATITASSSISSFFVDFKQAFDSLSRQKLNDNPSKLEI